MTTQLEYAALSAFIYNDQRGNGQPLNKIQLPGEWSQLGAAIGFTSQTAYDANFFSFTAGAFVNTSTGEIVVSYKGTDFLLEFSGRAWNTVADLITDVGAGVGSGLSAAQFVQAATYYEDVKSWAIAHSYDPSKISLTGHSLGAGLASVMSVWFNRLATVFADAPFEPSARSASVLAQVTAALAVNGVSDPDFVAFVADSIIPGTPVFSAREARVKNYYNRGEFLDYLRFPFNAVYGSTTPIDIGGQPLSRALALHSMNLHAAFLYDDRLRELASTMQQLLPALLDTKLYASDPNGGTKDLVTSLVNDQIRQSFSSDSALKRFTSDLLALNAPDGMAAQTSVQKGLLVAAMEYYYFKDSASTTALFTTSGNGIHFKFDDIGVPQLGLKSPRLLEAAVLPYLSSEESRAVGNNLETQSAWHVQTGTAGMNWTASAAAYDVAIGGAQTDIFDGGVGDDILVGGAGQDFLTGGTGRDTLIGGVDLDWLDGGSDNDTLMGGQGADLYHFAADWGTDIVVDGSVRISVFEAGC